MILQYLFLLFCFFPFVGPHIGTDMQPFAFFMAIILLLLKGKISICDVDIKYFSFWLTVLMGFVLISYLINDPFQVTKRLFSYASIIVIPITVYNCVSISKEQFEKILKVAILIWLFVGLVQRFINPSFMTQFMSYYRNPFGRGVCSLSCEPSFYGYMMFFFSLLASKFDTHKYLYICICIIQVVFLSQSVTVFLYYAIFGVFYFVGSHKFILKKMLMALGIAGVALVVICYIMGHMQGTRMYNLLYMFIKGGYGLLSQDQSVIERTSSLMLSFSKHGIPSFLGDMTIMSGLGGVIYDLGFFCIPIFYYVFKPFTKRKDMLWVYGITLFICMFSAIQLSSPTFALIVGLAIRNDLNGSDEYESTKIGNCSI